MEAKANENELIELGKIIEVLGKNSQTLMIESHNKLVLDFLKLFDNHHISQKEEIKK